MLKGSGHDMNNVKSDNVKKKNENNINIDECIVKMRIVERLGFNELSRYESDLINKICDK